MELKIENRTPALRLYRLTRTNPSDDIWQSSGVLPPVVQVWAQDEAQARYCAGATFKAYSAKGCPWLRIDFVKVESAAGVETQLPVLTQERKMGIKGRPKGAQQLSLKPPKPPRPQRPAQRPG